MHCLQDRLMFFVLRIPVSEVRIAKILRMFELWEPASAGEKVYSENSSPSVLFKYHSRLTLDVLIGGSWQVGVCVAMYVQNYHFYYNKSHIYDLLPLVRATQEVLSAFIVNKYTFFFFCVAAWELHLLPNHKVELSFQPIWKLRYATLHCFNAEAKI